jgi:hypothetical protein
MVPSTPPATSDPPRPATLGLAALLVVAAALAQLWLIRDLQQLPSPLFGGDYMYQAGCIESIRASGNPLATCSVCGALPGYLPLYGTLVAGFSWATHLPVVPSMLWLSALFRALSVALVFLVIADLFGASCGLLVAGLWAGLNAALLVKYVDFTAAIVVPVYYHALYRTLRSPRPAPALYLGLVLAVAGYSHAVVFIGGTVIAVGCVLLAALGRLRAGGRGELWAAARTLAFMAACQVLALGYWYRPIFVYHGRTSLHYVEWNGGETLTTLARRLAFARELLGSFLQFDHAAPAALHLLFLLGVLAAVRAGVRDRFAAALLMAGATLAWAFHYLLTVPLLGTHFVPGYVWRFLWSFAILLVAAIPVTLLFDRVRGGGARLGLEALATALGLALLLGGTRAIAQGPDLSAARRPLPGQYISLQQVVKRNTRPDDVFLSTNELSFALSALTGRQVLVTRRAQNDAFVDMDERNRDAALILYGNDGALRRRLLQRWNIRYLLWSTDWEEGEYQRDAQGKAHYSDPLMFFYNPAYESELQRAGVTTVTDYLWVDPFLRGDEYPRFDLTLVTPDNYQAPDHPWRPALDSLMREVWSTSYDGRKIVAVYRFLR